MHTFLKAQSTSLIASAVDFLFTILCVSLWHSAYVSASVAGAVCGGLVSFILARYWAFAAASQPIGLQFGRFLLVWLGNTALNTSGLFLTTQLLHLHYLLAKVAVAILVAVGYNYFFQKDFVFRLS